MPHPSRTLSQKTLAHLLLLAVALLWGATFTLVKSSLADITPLLFNLLRFALATAVLLLVNRRSLCSLTREHLQAGAAAGLFLALGYQFQTLGLARTTPAKSAFITGLVVIFVPALTLIPALRPAATPPPGLPSAAGAILAFAGLGLLTSPPHTSFANLGQGIGAGDLLTLAGALGFALHLLTLARVSHTIPSGLLATLQIAFATLFMLLTLPLEHPRATFTPLLILSLLICSVLATAAAFTVQSFAQQTLPPTHTVLILALEPVFGYLISLLILHDVLAPRALLGAALILAGILLVELLPNRHSTEIPA